MDLHDPEGAFDMGIAHLRLFIQRAGHSRVLRNHHEGYFALGRWVEDIRERAGRLGDRRVRQLDSLAGWDWTATAQRSRRDHEANFDDGFRELLRYVETNGTARVSQLSDGVRSELGVWVKARRTDRKWGRLSNDQIAALDAVPGWVWDEQLARFMDSVALTRSYVEKHGVLPPSSYRDPDTDMALGQWIAARRRDYRRGQLGHEREAALASVPGWTWG
ncbi:helicase associated domain-containing protein [Microbacterium sp. PRC9]|uniref:helicase associated domain-containing protein n=1 Tax=Microbacterium sp. PRC9 TaxID=2962591 RepID=UPI0028828A5F|nr:helicase associated domain-containing protein [Microbacterium sp. PRC9]MDT0143228.1 helicase associated domain-containing protein [Microbacterium sp. PRC9]